MYDTIHNTITATINDTSPLATAFPTLTDAHVDTLTSALVTALTNTSDTDDATEAGFALVASAIREHDAAPATTTAFVDDPTDDTITITERNTLPNGHHRAHFQFLAALAPQRGIAVRVHAPQNGADHGTYAISGRPVDVEEFTALVDFWTDRVIETGIEDDYTLAQRRTLWATIGHALDLLPTHTHDRAATLHRAAKTNLHDRFGPTRTLPRAEPAPTDSPIGEFAVNLHD